MKRTDIKLISDVIREHLSELDRSGKLSETRALVALDEVMGNGLAQYIDDKYIKEGILYLKTKSSSLSNEIFINKTNLIQQINKIVGSDVIKGIRVD